MIKSKVGTLPRDQKQSWDIGMYRAWCFSSVEKDLGKLKGQEDTMAMFHLFFREEIATKSAVITAPNAWKTVGS